MPGVVKGIFIYGFVLWGMSLVPSLIGAPIFIFNITIMVFDILVSILCMVEISKYRRRQPPYNATVDIAPNYIGQQAQPYATMQQVLGQGVQNQGDDREHKPVQPVPVVGHPACCQARFLKST